GDGALHHHRRGDRRREAGRCPAHLRPGPARLNGRPARQQPGEDRHVYLLALWGREEQNWYNRDALPVRGHRRPLSRLHEPRVRPRATPRPPQRPMGESRPPGVAAAGALSASGVRALEMGFAVNIPLGHGGVRDGRHPWAYEASIRRSWSRLASFGSDPYLYSGNNPTTSVDLTGLHPSPKSRPWIGDYGRYCGYNLNGPGDPIDCIDAACMVHDICLTTWWDACRPGWLHTCNQLFCTQAMWC